MSLSHPGLWGPYMWYLLHLISFSNNPESLTTFFQSISEVFPCIKCQGHYQDHLKNHHIPSNNLDDWLIDIHNRVRRYQKKSELNISDARLLYFVNDILPVNHIHIWNLLHILKESPIADKIPIFIQQLIPIFPCLQCRNIMIANKENLDVNNIIKIILDHQMTTEEESMLARQGFQLILPTINRDIGGIEDSEQEYYEEVVEKRVVKKKVNIVKKKCWKPVKKIKAKRRL